MVVAPVAGAVFDKVGARPLIVPGLLMQAAGFGWIVYLAAHSAGYAGYVAPFILAGVGISMALPCVSAAGLNSVGPPSLGKAAGDNGGRPASPHRDPPSPGMVTVNGSRLCWVAIEPTPVTAEPAGASAVSR